MDEAEIVTVAKLVEMHEELVQGSVSSRPKPDCLEAATGGAEASAAYHMVAGEFPSLCYAALLLRNLAQRHCFIDGNKRVAFEAMVAVLQAHMGMTMDCSQREAADMVLHLVNDKPPLEETVEWLAERLVPGNLTREPEWVGVEE